MTRKEMMTRMNAGEDPLEISIQKWQDIVDGTGTDEGIYNCALCYKYLQIENDCKRCPIYEKTGEKACRGTPYNEHPYDPKKVLDFLKSLRKEE